GTPPGPVSLSPTAGDGCEQQPTPPRSSDDSDLPPITGMLAGIMVLLASVSEMNPRSKPFTSPVAGLPTYVAAMYASRKVTGKLTSSVTVPSAATKHGALDDVTARLSPPVVPTMGVRQKEALFVYEYWGSTASGEHEVPASGAVHCTLAPNPRVPPAPA